MNVIELAACVAVFSSEANQGAPLYPAQWGDDKRTLKRTLMVKQLIPIGTEMLVNTQNADKATDSSRYESPMKVPMLRLSVNQSPGVA